MVDEQSIGVFGSWGESLGEAFFARSPLEVAPELLGCVMESVADDVPVAGRIVETEAYLGADDPGSHAATKGITTRNSVMYGPPGRVYVYFTYGNHFMLNLVCGPLDVAGAVLIRALEPLAGHDVMQSRREGRSEREWCSGPGKLARALAVDLTDNGTTLGVGRLRVYAGMRPRPGEVATSSRVGLTTGQELPYRFFECGNPYVSRGRTGTVRRSVSVRAGRGRSAS